MINTRLSRPGIIVSALLLLVGLAACSSSSSPATEAPGPDLAGTMWNMDVVNDIPASTEEQAVIFFAREGGLLGYTGCNIVSGNYQTSGSQISISVNVVTPFNCSDELVLQEQALVQTITKASKTEIEGDQLRLSNPDDSLWAEFTSTELPELGGTSWQLNSYNDGQGAFVILIDGTEITAEFGTDGTLTGFAGCNNYNTTYTTEGDLISIGPVASTMMACSDPEGVMDQETGYLSAIQTAVRYVNLGPVLYLWDEKDQPAALYFSTER